MVRGAAESNSTRSVGLGLFIVNEIAKSHGGRMELVSSVEEGTRFILRFSSAATSFAFRHAG
jgi:sigma-B regulation protein RsbU (phosphoserine phosphatase)